MRPPTLSFVLGGSFLLVAALVTLSEAQGLLPAPRTPAVITSDFGPRNVTKGSFFHPGIDYRGDVGDSILPVEEGRITSITVGALNIWYISILGDTSRQEFKYLHIFPNDPPQSSSNPNLIRESSTNGRPVTLEFVKSSDNVPSCGTIIFWADSNKTIADHALSECRRVFVGSQRLEAITNITAADLLKPIAPVGTSGGFPPHLHLKVSDGRINPLLYVQHDTSDIRMLFEALTADGTLRPGRDRSPLPVKVTVDSTVGLDLNRVDLYIYRKGSSKLNAIRSESFLFGGRLDEAGQRKNVEARSTNGSTGPDPVGTEPGVDRFIYSLEWATLGPGEYIVEANAYNVLNVLQRPISMPFTIDAPSSTISGSGSIIAFGQARCPNSSLDTASEDKQSPFGATSFSQSASASASTPCAHAAGAASVSFNIGSTSVTATGQSTGFGQYSVFPPPDNFAIVDGAGESGVGFHVDVPVLSRYQVTGNLSTSCGPPVSEFGCVIRVELLRGGSAERIFAFSIVGGNSNQPLSATGMLAPGGYDLGILGTASVVLGHVPGNFDDGLSSSGTAAASFGILFELFPEP